MRSCKPDLRLNLPSVPWRFAARTLAAALPLAALGAALPFAVATAVPPQAHQTLVVADGADPAPLLGLPQDAEALLAMVRALDLSRHPALRPQEPTVLALIGDLMTGSVPAAGDPLERAAATLAGRLAVVPAGDGRRVTLILTAENAPSAAALLARIGDFLATDGLRQPVIASASPYAQARAALAAFEQGLGAGQLAQALVAEEKVLQARAAQERASAAVAVARQSRDRIRSGGVDPAADPARAAALDRLAAAEADWRRLGESLGPRHPAYIAALSAVDRAREAVRRQDASARAAADAVLAAATAAESRQRNERDAAEAALAAIPVDRARYHALRRALEAAGDSVLTAGLSGTLAAAAPVLRASPVTPLATDPGGYADDVTRQALAGGIAGALAALCLVAAFRRPEPALPDDETAVLPGPVSLPGPAAEGLVDPPPVVAIGAERAALRQQLALLAEGTSHFS